MEHHETCILWDMDGTLVDSIPLIVEFSVHRTSILVSPFLMKFHRCYWHASSGQLRTFGRDESECFNAECILAIM